MNFLYKVLIKMVFASLDGIKSDKNKELYLTYVSSVMTTSLNEIFKAIFFFWLVGGLGIHHVK